jgi:hypothetical protein
VKLRTTLLTAASVVALVAGLAAPAGAATAPINVAADHLTCNSTIGSFKFNPPLVGGGSTTTQITVKATLAGCSDPDNANVQVLSGAAATPKTGPLAGTNNDCLTLLGLNTAPGSIITKWKTLTGQPKITPAATTLSVTNIQGGVFGPVGGWSGSYGEFQVGTTFGTATPSIPVGSAFRGGDGGHNSTIDVTTGADVGYLGVQCINGIPIKTAVLGIGSVTFG